MPTRATAYQTERWPADALRRLGAAVRARRLDLGYTSRDAFAAAIPDAPSETPQEVVENGRGYPRKADTIARYERALGWAPGSFEAILTGGRPTSIMTRVPVTSGGVEAIVHAVRDLTPDERRQVADLLARELPRTA